MVGRDYLREIVATDNDDLAEMVLETDWDEQSNAMTINCERAVPMHILNAVDDDDAVRFTNIVSVTEHPDTVEDAEEGEAVIAGDIQVEIQYSETA